jgi:hypothetical protein
MTQPIPRDAIYRRRVFDAEVIELCVRWYITYRLSYRDVVEIMAERGVQVAHTTILRWVLRYVPEYEKRWSRFLKPVGTSWRVDETSCCARTAGSRPRWPSFAKHSGRSLQRYRGRSRSMVTARAGGRCGCCDASTRAGATCAFEPTATSTTSSSRIIVLSNADVPRWRVSNHSPRPLSQLPGSSSPTGFGRGSSG